MVADPLRRHYVTAMDAHDGPEHPNVASASLVEVAPSVYAWVQPDGSWWVNNAGAISGLAGTCIVDTCATDVRTANFLAAVRRATDDAPLRWAVNTHEHGDHTYGNSLLPESCALIGHEVMRTQLLADPLLEECPPAWSPVPNWGAVTRRVPSITTTSELVVHDGSRRIELRHPGFVAHTRGDLVAWLPDERVLFTGDLLFSGLTPLVFAGSVHGALRTLDWLADFGPEVVVPGHGPLISGGALSTVLAEHERYYRFILELAQRAEGRTALEVATDVDLGEFAHWADPERVVLNLHRALAEAQGRELDVFAAVVDAGIWNGGPFTTHVCCL